MHASCGGVPPATVCPLVAGFLLQARLGFRLARDHFSQALFGLEALGGGRFDLAAHLFGVGPTFGKFAEILSHGKDFVYALSPLQAGVVAIRAAGSLAEEEVFDLIFVIKMQFFQQLVVDAK